MEQAKPAGWSPCLYQRDRASLSMDFIASLPKVGEDGPPLVKVVLDMSSMPSSPQLLLTVLQKKLQDDFEKMM